MKMVQTTTGYVRSSYPWKMEDIEAHLAGTKTYGYYLLDQFSKCKLFCFNINLVKIGSYPEKLDAYCFDEADNFIGPAKAIAPIEVWKDRKHPARPWLKLQLGMIAGLLAQAVHKKLEIPVTAAYSGNKGIHVYGFTDEIPASEASLAAQLVLNSLGCFEQDSTVRESVYHHVDQSILGYPNISVEVFPKTDSQNVLRLPLGKNLDSNDPTFFIDMKTRPGLLTPHKDPYELLKTGDPWS
jgi:hypothetical protein